MSTYENPFVKELDFFVFCIFYFKIQLHKYPSLSDQTILIGVRATSHMRLRARDRYTSSTLIGGKGGAGPHSLLHTTLEGPTEYVCECKMDVKSTWIHTWHQMDHVSWSHGLFSKFALGGRPHTKPGDHDAPRVRTLTTIGLFYFIMV